MLKLKRPTLFEAISLIGILGIFVLIFYPVYMGSRPVSGRTRCISNFKQLGVAFQIYLGDFDDRFPVKSWHDELMPYTKDEQLMFMCPAILEKHLKWGYAFNYELLGKDVNKVPNPEKYPMLFEIDALAKDVVANFAARAKVRHGRTTVLVHCDSSTQSLTEPP